MSYPPTPPTYTITEELDYPANIWRWATTDPVKGASGAGATDDVDNYPITQLANRTKYLKAISNGMLTKSVAGSADVALTAAEAANGIIKLTGALTDDINVTVPDGTIGTRVIVGEFLGDNVGVPYKVTFKTVSGSGCVITKNTQCQIACDGVNVIGEETGYTDVDSGYITLFNGITLNWGKATTPADSNPVAVTFAKPFSVACLHVVVGGESGSGTSSACAHTYSTTGCNLAQQARGGYPITEGQVIHYLAIGY